MTGAVRVTAGTPLCLLMVARLDGLLRSEAKRRIRRELKGNPAPVNHRRGGPVPDWLTAVPPLVLRRVRTIGSGKAGELYSPLRQVQALFCSGMVEGGCKTVAGKRLQQTGAGGFAMRSTEAEGATTRRGEDQRDPPLPPTDRSWLQAPGVNQRSGAASGLLHPRPRK
jgi:hypothetical protein